jgi:prophage antirepressor-like protein
MTNLSVFNFNSNQVRIVSVDGEPWFVARDVLVAAKSSTTVTAMKAMIEEGLGEEFVINKPLLTDGGVQETLLVAEAGITFFISRSRTELGKAMNRWIHVEVLPTIRKTGTYSVKPAQGLMPVNDIKEVMLAVYSHTGINEYLLAGAIATEIGKQRPEYKALVESIKQDIPGVKVEEKLVRPGKLAELYESKTGIKLSAQKMNKLLEDKGLQIKNVDGANPSWLPTEEGKEYSQMVLDTAKGHNKTVQSLQWYPSVIEVI